MNREEFTEKFLSAKDKNYILQLPTGFGKSLLALQKMDTWCDDNSKILIVVPRLVLIKNWYAEIEKFNYSKYLPNITFTTYISLYKHCNVKWNCVIADEAHHTSERSREALDVINTDHIIALSATLKREITQYYKYKFGAKVMRVGLRDAIEEEVLPDPKVILIPLTLNNSVYNQVIEKNIKKNSKTTVKTIKYYDKYNYRNYTGPLRIECTAFQYYNDISNLIEWYKKKGMYSSAMRNIWLYKAGERLKWLAQQKENIVKNIIKSLKNYRTLVFCQSIEQSKTLGCPCVNSEVGTDNLDLFNAKKIKHISTVKMVDEGINLKDCKIGLFQMINSSDLLTQQRSGRILRHKSPVLIFPYYAGTREEEIMRKITENYNPELIVKLSQDKIKDVINYVKE